MRTACVLDMRVRASVARCMFGQGKARRAELSCVKQYGSKSCDEGRTVRHSIYLKSWRGDVQRELRCTLTHCRLQPLATAWSSGLPLADMPSC